MSVFSVLTFAAAFRNSGIKSVDEGKQKSWKQPVAALITYLAVFLKESKLLAGVYILSY